VALGNGILTLDRSSGSSRWAQHQRWWNNLVVGMDLMVDTVMGVEIFGRVPAWLGPSPMSWRWEPAPEIGRGDATSVQGSFMIAPLTNCP
jgi:hypothetical protein